MIHDVGMGMINTVGGNMGFWVWGAMFEDYWELIVNGFKLSAVFLDKIVVFLLFSGR